MTAYDIIKKKRDNSELSFEEIDFFVNNYVSGDIPDYQMSSLLMAIYLNGMSDIETAHLTKIMASSGEVVNLDVFGNLTVDKHSTGGVGDKTTLIVAPIAASLGCKVAKMSGRGLGFTGGTYDKLSSIPGYKIALNCDEFLSIVDKTGISIIGQSKKLTPADKKIYALRDVTATVESIPLIASSIMSKKIAAGAKNIVLDVKYGTGAFMKTPETAVLLAEKMVNIGKQFGKKTTAVITDMNKPLGYAVGNNLEVVEAIQFLKGKYIQDLYDECITISALMVSSVKGISLGKAKELSINSVKSGAAYKKFVDWISSQGGDVSYIENTEKFPRAKYSTDVISNKSGYIGNMDTEIIGEIAGMLGAGRLKIDDEIDYSAGIILDKKTGEYINKGGRLCTLYSNNKGVLDNAVSLYHTAIGIYENIPEMSPEIYKIVF